MPSITRADSRADQKSRSFGRIVCAVLALVTSTLATAAEIRVWAWSPSSAAHSPHVNAMVAAFPNTDPAIVASRLNALPAGQRVLLIAGMTERLASHPADACRKAGARGKITLTSFPGPWCTAGEVEVRARMARFFDALKTAGVNSLDAVVLDNEVTFWAGRYIAAGRENLAAIQADPRFPALARRLGINRIDRMNYGTSEFLRWNEVLQGDFDRALDRCMTPAVHKHWPRAVICNYNSALIRRDCMTPDESGIPVVRGGTGFGTHDSLSFYANSRPWIKGREYAGTRLDDSPFDMFRMMVHRIRATDVSSTRPMLPWIANFSLGLRGECEQPGSVEAGMHEYASPLAGDVYWDENLIQLVMHGCDTIIMWNPVSWRRDQNPNIWNPVEDQHRLDGLLADLNQRLVGATGERRWYSVSGFEDRVLATGRRVEGGTLWRFSFAPDVSSVVVTLRGGEVQEILREEGAAGAWYFESDSQPLAMKDDGSDIAWIEAPKGSTWPDLDDDGTLSEGDVALLLLDMGQESEMDLDGDRTVTQRDVDFFRANRRGWAQKATAGQGWRPGSVMVASAR